MDSPGLKAKEDKALVHFNVIEKKQTFQTSQSLYGLRDLEPKKLNGFSGAYTRGSDGGLAPNGCMMVHN